jgi:hypothetical protein
MTFGTTQVGELPAGLKLLSGSVDVVDVGGVHMLRASSQSELELPLPQALPQDFTVELEFIPKQCCNPHDIGIEGTSVGHSNPGSSQITWHRNRLTVIGGGESFATDMPDVLASATPGMPTVLTIVMQGPTLKLYTNGRRIYTLSDRKFVRAQKLWIYLGGQDEDKYAVYVSRIRVIDNVAPVGPVVASSPPPPAAGGGAPPPAPAGAAPISPTTVPPAMTTGTTTPTIPAPASSAPASPAPVTAVPPATTTGTATAMPAPSTGTTTGATGSPTSPAPSSTSRTANAMSMQPCTATTTPGLPPAPKATAQWPSGLAMEWLGTGTSNYAIDRAPDGTTNWTFVGSTCGGPSPVRKTDNGNGTFTYSVRDLSGGVNGNQVYRVTMIDQGGTTGWNTLHWPAPCTWAPSVNATVTGSTVTLKWFAGSPPCTSKMPGISRISGPDSYTIASSYGYTKSVWAGVTTDVINLVPVGDHTFTVTSEWTPDKKASRTINVSVKY